MCKLQALIFDVDGTLADTERHGHRVAFNRAFAAAGLDWEWSAERYGKLLEISGGKERIQHYIQQDLPTFQPPSHLPSDLAELAAMLHQEKSAHYRQVVQAGLISVRPGVRRLLQSARDQGIRLAIATTSAPDNVMALLETALAPDSPTWFEVIAAGDIVPAKKPAPDVYQYVLHVMQLDSAHCLAIEDSYAGLQAARQAGLKTVITVNPYTQTQDFSAAALVLDQLGEPDQPFQVLAGHAKDAVYFDVHLAQELLSST